MTFKLSSRTMLNMNFAIAALAIVGSAALSTPASAAAKQKDVVAACKRTAGCLMFPGINGGVGGCSPHACFTCSNGKCTQTTTRTTNVPLTNRATANGNQMDRGNAAPANIAASSSNHMRMGGRH